MMSSLSASKLQDSPLLFYFTKKYDWLPKILFTGLFILLLSFLSTNTFAQEDSFSIPASPSEVKKQTINLRAVSVSQEVNLATLPVSIQNLHGLAITASFALRLATPFGVPFIFFPDDPSAFVRIVLIDQNTQQEYLVYQKNYQDLTPEEYNTTNRIKINAVCQETCVLPQQITSFSLRAEARHGEITVTEISYVDTPLTVDAATLRKKQNDLIIEKLNEQDLGWIAGETSVSNLTYEEKKRLVNLTDSSGEFNLQGFEYYRGGIFELKSKDVANETRKSTRASALVENFDWRIRHGKNWVTSVKDQGRCGSCYVHSSIATVEAVAKLYFNDPLWDLDLSEQEVLSCGGIKSSDGKSGVSFDGTCLGGGWGFHVLGNYIANSGVVDEECFEYKEIGNRDLPYQFCSLKCANPKEKIQISGVTTPFSEIPFTEDNLKQVIIENGPVDSGINSLHHAMLLIGFKTDSKDGRTIWIFKNSWGSDWGGPLESQRDETTGEIIHWGNYQDQGRGENGYAYVKLETSNIGGITVAKLPVKSSTQRQIACVDEDHDNYCNWGISKDKPSICPASCKAEKDCDDSDAQKGPFDTKYDCPNTNNAPDPQSPIASFTISPSKGEAPLTVTLDASASKDPDGTITRYDWSKVRANTYESPTNITSNNAPIISHTFETAGQFEVILVVTDAQGLQSEEHKIVTVTGGSQSQLFDLEAIEGSTFAWDATGEPVKSGAILKGGISVAGGPYQKLVKFSDQLGHGGQAQSVTIKGSITPDPKHDGKLADVFVFGEYVSYGGSDLGEQSCPPDPEVKSPFFYAMKGSPKNDADASKPRNYVLWEGPKTPTTVPVLYEGVSLKTGQEQQFTLFEGPFDARGCLSISFGYHLKESAVVVYNHHTTAVDNTIGVTVRKK